VWVVRRLRAGPGEGDRPSVGSTKGAALALAGHRWRVERTRACAGAATFSADGGKRRHEVSGGGGGHRGAVGGAHATPAQGKTPHSFLPGGTHCTAGSPAGIRWLTTGGVGPTGVALGRPAEAAGGIGG
jgi:hypothetical protein